MLNYYYWYSIITSLILFLYILPFSYFNSKLDISLVILILISIILALILGFNNRNKFYFKLYDYKEEKHEYLPLILIIILSIFEFVYTNDIPLFSVTINQLNSYQEFESIPFLHVFISMLSLYYSVKYVHKAISCQKKRKKNLTAYIIINTLMLMYNMRSFLMISLFIAINLLIAKIRLNSKIKFKYVCFSFVFLLILLYFFGGYGNMRQGYDWNDNSYIRKLGMYYDWPFFIPEQYMWSYSYITSPLANLNYNVANEKNIIDYSKYLFVFFPESISKRLPGYDTRSQCKLIRSYFNVSTGYCNSYSNGGLFGVIIFWLIIMFFPLFFLQYNSVVYKSNNYMIWLSIHGSCIAFMFFNNMFAYGGTSPALWMATFLLINKIRFVMKGKNRYDISNITNL